MNEILKGYTVIELSSVLAGPYAGMMFSELGAKVIKIENETTNGDVTRSWRHPSENKDTNISTYYSSTNYKKEILFMDLSKMNHINKVYKLIKTADVVITNFKQGDDFKFALDYGRVKVINPKIIYGTIKGFDNQPKRVAYDVVIQAECGYMSMNGQADSPPTKMPVALMDVLAGHQLRSGILAALLRREKTKKGALVQVSLEKSAISSLVNQGSNYLMNGIPAKRIGSRHPNIALYGEVFTTLDNEEIVLALGSQKHFQSLCRALNVPDILDEENYSSNQKRLVHIELLVKKLEPEFLKYNFSQLKTKMSEYNIPYGKINDMKTVANSETGKSMTMHEEIQGEATTRFSTIAFEIK